MIIMIKSRIKLVISLFIYLFIKAELTCFIITIYKIQKSMTKYDKSMVLALPLCQYGLQNIKPI